MRNYILLGWTIVFSMLLFIVLSVYVLWAVYRPITVLSIDNPVKVVTTEYREVNGATYPVVRRGEDFTVSFTYNKFVSIPEHTYRTILCEDGNLVTLTDIHKNLVLGKHIVEHFNGLVIPDKTSVNTVCYIRYLITYEVNSFRQIVVPTQTEPFYVIEGVQE